jgi:broad specificity phosphatase PhoE
VRVSLYLFSTTTTVVLVRHAEKAPPESGPDPVLSAEGQERALRLARLLGEADVAAVYASDTRRAQLTASPLAARLGVTVTTRAGNDVEGLLDDIGEHHQGERVVVIGHSNTDERRRVRRRLCCHRDALRARFRVAFAVLIWPQWLWRLGMSLPCLGIWRMGC